MVVLPNIRRKYMVGRIPKGATVPMSDCVVTLATDSATYTGSARTVGVTVTWEGATLAVNTDYTLAYSNNVNLGPATVTVTGMGQFSGSVTKTFHIVEASASPWSFDLTKTRWVSSKTISATNFQYMLPVVPGYSQTGAVVPIHQWLNGCFIAGYSMPLDGNGELHVANLDNSSPAFTDVGVDSDYAHPFHFDKTRSFWLSNNGSYVLKAKDGTASPDFSEVLGDRPSLSYRPMFANGGRRLIVPQANWKVCMFDLGTAYDISTVNLSSKREATFGGLSTYNNVQYVLFGNGGSQALVSCSVQSYVYHVSCPNPYDLTGAEIISQQNFSSTVYSVRAIAIVNDGQTLMMSGSNGISEYDLVA